MNKIIITDNFEKASELIAPDEKIITDELKVDDVAKIRHLAYIAEKRKKIILIAAEKYNVASQNALLKLLEEPPKNIEFVLLAASKYSLLDTIKSRLVVEKRFFNENIESDIDIDKISNDKIFELLKMNLEKSEIKKIIYKILKRKELNEEQLKILNDSIAMLELNIDKDAVLSLIMLSLKERI